MSEQNQTGGQGRRGRGMHLFDIVPGKHQPKLVRNGAIFIVIAGIFLYIIYTKPAIPLLSSSGTKVHMDFAYAADVSPGRTPVRVKGIDVGVVTGEKEIPAGGNGPDKKGVELTITMNKGSDIPIVKSDASAALRWRTLLGLNYYVDLDPGSTSAPPLGKAVINEKHTSSQVELDQVLEPLNNTGRTAVQTMFNQFNTGLGDPAAVRGSINSLGPAMKNLAAGLPGVRGTDPGVDLPHIITYTNKWADRLANDEGNLGQLVGNGDIAVGTTADQAGSIGSTLATAPGALEQTDLTMVRLRKTLSTLNPIAQDLEPGAKDLYGAAVKARHAVLVAKPLLVDLKPSLAALKPSIVSLSRTAKTATPVINNLNPTLDRTLNTFLPFLNQYSTEPNDSSKKSTGLTNYENVGPTLAAVDAVLDYGDQYGTLAGFHGGAGEDLVDQTSPCSTFITNPDVTQKVDCEALTQILGNVFDGTPVTQAMKGSPEPQSLVKKVLGLVKK